MDCSWDTSKLLSQFAPILNDGQLVHSSDGLIMFVRLSDNKSIGFQPSQIDMEALKNHIDNKAASLRSSDKFHTAGVTQEAFDPIQIMSNTKQRVCSASDKFVSNNIKLGPHDQQSHTSEMQQDKAQRVQGKGEEKMNMVQEEDEEDFAELQQSLQDMPGMKVIMSELALSDSPSKEHNRNNSTHHQYNQQNNQDDPGSISPNCDQELQRLADLVSSSLEKDDEQVEMELEDFAHSAQTNQPDHHYPPKQPNNVRISLSPLNPGNFHVDLDNVITKSLAKQTPGTYIQQQTQQPHAPTLAPIQTLLSSLRQKNSQQSQKNQSLLCSSQGPPTQILYSQPSPLISAVSQSQDMMKEPPKDKDVEAFFSSVSVHMKSNQCTRLPTDDKKQMQKHQPYQQLRQNLVFQPAKTDDRFQSWKIIPRDQHDPLRDSQIIQNSSSIVCDGFGSSLFNHTPRTLDIQHRNETIADALQNSIIKNSSNELNSGRQSCSASQPQHVMVIDSTPSLLSADCSTSYAPTTAGHCVELVKHHSNTICHEKKARPASAGPSISQTNASGLFPRAMTNKPQSNAASPVSAISTMSSNFESSNPAMVSSLMQTNNQTCLSSSELNKQSESFLAGKSSFVTSNPQINVGVPSLQLAKSRQMYSDNNICSLDMAMTGNPNISETQIPTLSKTTTSTGQVFLTEGNFIKDINVPPPKLTGTSFASTHPSLNLSYVSSSPIAVVTDQIWMNAKTPQARLMDLKATRALIQLLRRPIIRAKLASTHITKKAVWNEIGLEMQKQGFVFGNAGEKCCQKWRNMERTYKDYEQSKECPTHLQKKKPDFYVELRALLSDKHDYKRLLVEDEELQNKGNESCMVMECGDETSQVKQTQMTIPEDKMAATNLVGPSSNLVTMEMVTDLPAVSVGALINESAHPISTNKAFVSEDSLEVNSEKNSTLIEAPSNIPLTEMVTSSTAANLLSIGNTSQDHSTSRAIVSSCESQEHSSLTTTLRSMTTAEEKVRDNADNSVLAQEVCRLQEVVETQSQEIKRLSSVLSSVQDLLIEQQRHNQAVRAESGRRFSELKVLIGQNQREKMKFMCDFLRVLQPLALSGTRRPKRPKGQHSPGNQDST